MTPKFAADDWLVDLDEECRHLIIAIGTGKPFTFAYLRKLFEEQVETTLETWEAKNLIASLAMTNPDVLKGRITLQNAAIERLTQARSHIQNALATTPAGKAVSPEAR